MNCFKASTSFSYLKKNLNKRKMNECNVRRRCSCLRENSPNLTPVSSQVSLFFRVGLLMRKCFGCCPPFPRIIKCMKK